MKADEIRDLAEEQKSLAVHILNRVFLNTPAGYENNAARDLVDFIVNAALLEMAAAQKAGTGKEEGK